MGRERIDSNKARVSVFLALLQLAPPARPDVLRNIPQGTERITRSGLWCALPAPRNASTMPLEKAFSRSSDALCLSNDRHRSMGSLAGVDFGGVCSLALLGDRNTVLPRHASYWLRRVRRHHGSQRHKFPVRKFSHIEKIPH